MPKWSTGMATGGSLAAGDKMAGLAVGNVDSLWTLTQVAAFTGLVANGGTGDTGTAWASYTPSVSAGSGTITTKTATGKYKTLGKTVWFQAKLVITTNGTGAGTVFLGLPVASLNDVIIFGRETAVGGASLQGTVSASGSTMNIAVIATNVYPGSDGATLVMGGVYEST